MGGGRHRGNKKGRNNKNKNNRQDRDSPSAPPRLSTEQIVETGNCRFECYYALQGIHNERFDETTGQLVECQSDAERETERRRWVDALKTSLPASFRIGKDVPAFYQVQLARELDDFIQRAVAYIPHPDDVQTDARGRSEADFAALEQTSVQTLSFLPYAYQLSLDRIALRKNPALKQLQEWLKMHSAEGHITRQETVSMIPPVLLNVNGNDRVLDMCAAPGSKTSQLLEDMSMTKQQRQGDDGDDGGKTTAETTVAATGCLIANDSNTHRAYLLSHQLRRILYHHPVALITTCNAQNFPGILPFDKILCDVPCSGDGTGRKNVDVWQKWANGGALGLHYLQLQIALRGVELLTVGGTMCYSTCSQNPVENEAVVAELLRTYNNNNNGDCLELVECRHLLPGFRTRPGRSHWKVLYEPKFDAAAAPTTRTMENGETTTTTSTEPPKEGRPIFMPTSWTDGDLLAQAKTVNLHAFTSYDEVPEPYRKKVRPTVFPPTAAEAATMHLERCLRCLPHDNNTGGFFTAILKKIAPMHNNRLDRRGMMTEEERAAKRQKVEATAAAASDAIANGRPAASATAAAAENDEKEHGTAAAAAQEALPPNEGRASARQKDKLDKDNFVEAPDEIMDSIIEFYGLSNGFDRHLFHYRSLGEKNTLYYVSPQVKAIFDLGMQDRITVVNTGLKAFARNAKRTDHVNGDYRICQESIHFLVNHMTKRKLTMPLCDFKQCLDGIAEKAMAIDLLSEPTQVKLMGLEPGSFVATIEGYDDQPERKLMACMWRNKAATVNCLVGKIELTGMRQKVDALEEQRVG